MAYLPTAAASLVADVKRYLWANRLDHRLDESARIGEQAFKIAEQVRRQSTRVPSEAAAAWQRDQQEGGGQRPHGLDDAMLARRVQTMSMTECGASRQRPGVHQNILGFLTGE